MHTTAAPLIHPHHSLAVWIGFNVFVILMLVLDLGLFHRASKEIKIKEAIWLSVFWTVLALLFNLGVYWKLGSDAAMKFFAGYVLERSLSVDNLFVFVLVFSYFKVPTEQQYRVLFWGILGALVMRAIFIFAGVAAIQAIHWIIYVFGGFLVYTGFKLFKEDDKEIEPEKNAIVKGFRRFVPMTENYEGEKFWVKRDARFWATPLLLVLIVVETTDIVFAVDSIPAILAVTTDSFLVYTSNVFAILGLRPLYFALAGMMKIFRYLHYGLGAILIFVGIKMIVTDIYHIPIVVALAVIAVILAA
ncbi:MAG TPA: TerC family protein, partial [Verrucomicrobiae bacterium]|nr:TerC family protein [Verrucomicrobiae bacterium]